MNATYIRTTAWTGLLVALIALTFWRGDTVQAFNPQPEPPAISFSVWDTAGLRVIATNPVNRAALGSLTCDGTVAFYDALGRSLGQQSFSLPDGMSSSFDIGDPNPTDRARSLIQVQAINAPRGCAALTVEIFDLNTLETYTSHSGSIY